MSTEKRNRPAWFCPLIQTPIFCFKRHPHFGYESYRKTHHPHLFFPNVSFSSKGVPCSVSIFHTSAPTTPHPTQKNQCLYSTYCNHKTNWIQITHLTQNCWIMQSYDSKYDQNISVATYWTKSSVWLRKSHITYQHTVCNDIEELWFNSQWGQETFLFSKTDRQASGPT
jgi:hypothetical protein